MSDSPSRRRSRRARRVAPASPLAHVPWQVIRNPMPPLTRLDAAAEQKIHDASMRILEDIGLMFMDDEALTMWQQAGARVDRARQHVWLDRGLVLELVARAPARFTWRARNPARSMHIGDNHITFVPNGGVVFAQDLDHGRRPGQLSDYHNFLKLMQMCNAIHYTGDQLVVPHDVPVSFRHLQRSLAAFTLSDKAYMEAPHGRIISADAVRMAQIVFGDDIVDAPEPVLGGVINASSPLRYDERMIGGILTFARANQVLVITPFILAGAMSPITMAAAIAQQNAEALAGIALAQLARPGAPVLYGGFATNMDMRTGSPAFGTPEGAWAMLVGAQMARRYNLPYRGSGSLNTAKAPDAQAAYETMWATWPAVLAHTNFIMHAVGWLEAGLTVSYEKIIIDMENLAMFQHFFGDVEISDETLALDMMAEVGPGGHHLGTAHTAARYATEFYSSFLADRQNYEAWQQNGAEDTAVRANKIWKQLLDAYEEPPLDDAIREALEDFVARRERELEGVDLYQ
ncbi:MAG: trimethylamine methyltransferase family protein [Anaerolineales bacterium]|nr:trimethylamine methyltransferase family protein [Anaerolineales bacterium]